MTPFHVAEISKNYERGGATFTPPTLAEQFEQVIATKLQEGYRLHSFQLHRLLTGPDSMNETIIAVFEAPTLRQRRLALRAAIYAEQEDEAQADWRRRDFVRASGRVQCSICRELYSDHPPDPVEPSLTLLCDRARVKL